MQTRKQNNRQCYRHCACVVALPKCTCAVLHADGDEEKCERLATTTRESTHTNIGINKRKTRYGKCKTVLANKSVCQLYRNKRHTYTSIHASISSLVFVCVLVGLVGWVVAYRELQTLFARLQLFGQNYHHLFA